MIRQNQKVIYAAIGKALTDYASEKKLSEYQVAKKVGEQYNTIKNMMDGNVCSLHHLFWMENVLNIDVSKIIKNAMESTNERKSELDDLI